MSDKASQPTFESKVKTGSPRFEHNLHAMAELVTSLRNEEEIIHEGGGEKAIESQHKKGRLTARERIALLIDPSTEFFELGTYTAWGMYEEWGGAPSAGVVTGLARVHSRLVMLIVNDATVKA
ncbi:MAG: carboxyl transferase domain-containing protein, partial [Candidatus Korobacteraceae bacterium]